MSLKQFLYPLDFTGERGSNRVEELHTIGASQYRVFALKSGPFYAHNLVIKERNTNKVLVRGTHYELVFFYQSIATMTQGKEVCGVVVITDPLVKTDLVVNANIVGGPYAATAEAIQKAIDDLELDNRNVYWKDVLEKPDLFQPTPHIHDLGDIFGFEFVIDVIAGIRDAILVGNNQQIEQMRQHLDQIVDNFNSQLDQHVKDQSNIHKVTSDQVNAYSKEYINSLMQGVGLEFANRDQTIAQLNQSLLNLGSDLQTLSSALSAYNQRVGVVEQAEARINALLAQINTALSNINQQITLIWNEIDKLKTKDIDLQQQIDANKNTLSSHSDTLANHNTRIGNLESRATASEEDIGQLQQDMQNVNDSLDDYIPRVEAYGAAPNTGHEYMKNKIPRISSAGVLDIGHILDRHASGTSNVDYSIRETTQWNASVNGYEVYVTGRYNVLDLYVRSDLRDKRDVREIAPTEADHILQQLGGGLRYKLLNEKHDTAGLGAQYVQKHFPEAIVSSKNEYDEWRLNVRYNAVIALLVSGYQHTADRLQEQQLELDALKKENQQIKELLNRVMNQLTVED